MAPATAPASHGYQAPISALYPSPLNPRQHFDDLDDLAMNIRLHGVLVPLLVRPTPGAGGLEIVDGERRFRAAQIAGNVQALPVVERQLADDQVLEIQLLSAIQRQALTPLEEARGYRRLIDSNPAKYSAAYVADRIGRSEKYVVDRMRLSNLIPVLQTLLEIGRIGVAVAELLAKLKTEDQERASDPGHDSDRPGGLWQRVAATLLDDEDEDAARTADPYVGLKPVTVKELEAWIARHVRFDVAHFAQTAPLDFGATAIAVEAAEQRPGRGKKVIQITQDYRIEDDIKDPTQRVYGAQSWKRADGTEGTSRSERYGGQPTDSPTCEHSVLGVVTAGPGYGTSFEVCIARDRCEVHWKKEIKEREKTAKARAAGDPVKVKAAPVRDSWEERQRREDAERASQLAAYKAVAPGLVKALLAAVPPKLDADVFAFLWARLTHGEKLPAVGAGAYTRELVRSQVDEEPSPYAAKNAFTALVKFAQHFGVDVKAFNREFDAQAGAAKKDAAAAARAAKKVTAVPATGSAAKAANVKKTATAKTAKKAAKKR